MSFLKPKVDPQKKYKFFLHISHSFIILSQKTLYMKLRWGKELLLLDTFIYM